MHDSIRSNMLDPETGKGNQFICSAALIVKLMLLICLSSGTQGIRWCPTNWTGVSMPGLAEDTTLALQCPGQYVYCRVHRDSPGLPAVMLRGSGRQLILKEINV